MMHSPSLPEIGATIHVKSLIATSMFVAVAVWSVVASFAFTPMFVTLSTNPLHGYGNALVEGLSAGAFLAKVAGIMVSGEYGGVLLFVFVGNTWGLNTCVV